MNITEKGEQYLQKLEEHLSTTWKEATEKMLPGDESHKIGAKHYRSHSEEMIRAQVLHDIQTHGKLRLTMESDPEWRQKHPGWTQLGDQAKQRQLNWLLEREYVEQ